jgi:hypothetical protein
MGYHVEVSIEEVTIPAGKVGAALTALASLMGQVQEKGGGGSYVPGKEPVKHYSWVTTATCLNHLTERNLIGFLFEWRYEASEGDPMTPVEQLAQGQEFCDVSVDYFDGGKWGDDEHLWKALAPFVEDGGVIEFKGEDGHYWRYVFGGGTMTEQTGTVVWEL